MLIFRLWAITFTQERAPHQTFTYSKLTIDMLRNKCEICSKLTLKTSGQLSTLLIVNLEHISLLFLVFCCRIRVPPYQFLNAKITYCCSYWQTCKNLCEIIYEWMNNLWNNELPFFYYKKAIAATHSFKFTVFLKNRNPKKEIS